MNYKEIQELIRMAHKNNIAEISIEENDFKIKIKTSLSSSSALQEPVYVTAPQIQGNQVQNTQATSTNEELAKTDEPTKNTDDKKTGNENLITIKSPIVGTFYRSSTPDKDPFIKVGDEVTVKDVLCIIEAMKLFNEIESEYNGKIMKILVEDASPVEYDQPLFLLESN